MFYLNLIFPWTPMATRRSPCVILTYDFYGLLGWKRYSGYLGGWKDCLDGNGTLDILVDGWTAWMATTLWISW